MRSITSIPIYSTHLQEKTLFQLYEYHTLNLLKNNSELLALIIAGEYRLTRYPKGVMNNEEATGIVRIIYTIDYVRICAGTLSIQSARPQSI